LRRGRSEASDRARHAESPTRTTTSVRALFGIACAGTTIAGLADWYDERCEEDPLNVNWWEGATGLAVLLDRGDHVRAAETVKSKAAASDPLPWVVEVHERTRQLAELYLQEPQRAWVELASRAKNTRSVVLGGIR
jgi:hypothetical protein